MITEEIFYRPKLSKEFKFICNENESGTRLDVFLFNSIRKNCDELISRNRIKFLIEHNYVEKDNVKIISPSTKTTLNSIYKLIIPPVTPAEPLQQNIQLDILYEDNDIIVVNKKSGMVVHPGFGNYSNTLVNALLYHCKGSLSGIGGVSRPGIVHRIDKDTSGVLVSAKNDYAHIHLSNQFKEHSITRLYTAIVWGILKYKNGTITNKIARNAYNRKKMCVSNNGKIAITHWEVEKTFLNMASLIKCKLETGRTHQIRVHFSNLGNNLIGDKLYSKPRSKKKFLNKNNQEIYALLKLFPRQALHAYSLSFEHPRNKKRLSFEVNPAIDMQNLLESLNKAIDKF